MNDKKLEIFKGIFKTELSPEQLSTASGGAHTPEQAKQLQDALKAAKEAGITQKEILDMVPSYFGLLSGQFPGVTLDEVTGYITSNWDNL